MMTDHQARPSETGDVTTNDVTMMSAIVHDRFGPPGEVLRFDQVARPTIDDDEVLVRVCAAAVDRGVWHLVEGKPYLIRLAGFGLRTPKHRVPGFDLAGWVAEVGSNVTGFAPGDEVVGIGDGSFAEYVSAPAAKLVPKPPSLTFEQAAALPISGLTALQAIRDHGRVEPGQKVLIIGASGGVGTYAVQVAKALGAEVTGVCSTAKLDMVRRLGADHVIDYTVGDLTSTDLRYDVVIDIGGNRSLRSLRRILAAKGTLVIVGGENGGTWIGGVDRQLRAMLWSPFLSQKLCTFVSPESGADLATLCELVGAGTVQPEIERTFALSDAPAAIEHVEAGRAKGKIVITV